MGYLRGMSSRTSRQNGSSSYSPLGAAARHAMDRARNYVSELLGYEPRLPPYEMPKEPRYAPLSLGPVIGGARLVSGVLGSYTPSDNTIHIDPSMSESPLGERYRGFLKRNMKNLGDLYKRISKYMKTAPASYRPYLNYLSRLVESSIAASRHILAKTENPKKRVRALYETVLHEMVHGYVQRALGFFKNIFMPREAVEAAADSIVAQMYPRAATPKGHPYNALRKALYSNLKRYGMKFRDFLRSIYTINKVVERAKMHGEIPQNAVAVINPMPRGVADDYLYAQAA